MASKQQLMDLPVELIQMIITYIPSRDLFNLRTIRKELTILIDKELRDRGQSTIKIKLKFVHTSSSFIPPT